MPLAPERFSTITGWPIACCSGKEMARARTSGELPGATFTMMCTGFAGQPSGPAARAGHCTPAAPASTSPTDASSLRRLGRWSNVCISSPFVLVGAPISVGFQSGSHSAGSSGRRRGVEERYAEVKTLELNSSRYAVAAYKRLGFFPISESFGPS